MTLYLISNNEVKIEASNQFIKLYNQMINNDYKNKFIEIKELIPTKYHNEIKGDQTYSLEEIKLRCINRIKHIKNNKNFISIENGFVKKNGEFWYDIAYVFIKINNKIYSKFSHKRNFPKDIYNNTNQLVKYFEKKNDTRYNQLYYCLKEIINDIFI